MQNNKPQEEQLKDPAQDNERNQEHNTRETAVNLDGDDDREEQQDDNEPADYDFGSGSGGGSAGDGGGA